MNNSTRRAALVALLLMSAPPGAVASEPVIESAGPATLSSDDMQFFDEAAQSGMLDVQAATIASTRALAPATRAYASDMAVEHGANNDALKQLAESKGMTLPEQLDGKRREMLSELQQGEPKDFDRRYAKAMRKDHHEAIELFKETAEESTDSEIRAFASNTLPTLQHHFDMASELTPKS